TPEKRQVFPFSGSQDYVPHVGYGRRGSSTALYHGRHRKAMRARPSQPCPLLPTGSLATIWLPSSFQNTHTHTHTHTHTLHITLPQPQTHTTVYSHHATPAPHK